MQIKVSSKGQVVLPVAIRNHFSIKEGDSMEAKVDGAHILLTPKKLAKRKGRIVRDPITGMDVLTMGPGAPKITSEWVARMMEDFP